MSLLYSVLVLPVSLVVYMGILLGAYLLIVGATALIKAIAKKVGL